MYVKFFSGAIALIHQSQSFSLARAQIASYSRRARPKKRACISYSSTLQAGDSVEAIVKIFAPWQAIARNLINILNI